MEAKKIPAYDLVEFSDLIRRSPNVLESHPCHVAGFVQQWPAYRRWNDTKYLAQLFGHFPVMAGAPQFITNKHAKICRVRTTFGKYLEYVCDPQKLDSLFEGGWIEGSAAMLRDLGLPLYCGNLQFVRHACEPVLADIEPLVPGSLEFFNSDIPYYYQSGNHVWLYVSLAGALTPLHQDNNAVIAYLAQIDGHKDAILYSPRDKAHFYNPAVGYMDPLHPDRSDFPTWHKAQPWIDSLSPGDLLIWGANWAHHVVTSSNSISISFDIVNRINLEAYATSVDWRAKLGTFARKHNALIRDRVEDEDVLRLLDNGSVDDLGCALMASVLRAALRGTLSERSRYVKKSLLHALGDAEAAA